MVRIFEDLIRKSRLMASKAPLKIRDRRAFSQMELVLDVQIEDLTGPGLHQCLSCVPFTKRRVGHLGDQRDNVKPR